MGFTLRWISNVLLLLLLGAIGHAQDIRFPSTVPMSDLTQLPPGYTQPPTGVRPITPSSTVSPYPPGTFPPGSVPTGTTAPGATFSAPSSAIPNSTFSSPAFPSGAPPAGTIPSSGFPAGTMPPGATPGATGFPTAAPTFDPYQAGAAYNPNALQNQQTLATWLGLPPNSFSNWFAGSTPTGPYGTVPVATAPNGAPLVNPYNPYGTTPVPNSFPTGTSVAPPGAMPTGAAPPGTASPGIGPAGSVPAGTFSTGGYPPGAYPANPYTVPQYGSPSYPSSVYPQGPPGSYPPGAYPPGTYPPGAYPSSNPQSLFPTGWPTDTASSFLNTQRFCLGPRFRHAWVTRDDTPNSLGINDTDVSIAFQIPNFFNSNQPLYLLPSFGLHVWDGPNGNTGADLPPLAYSAFLDAGWESDPNQIIGADLGVRVGAFTDFNTFNSDSWRYMGKALAKVRITPTMLFRLGVIYADRNQIKLIPAGGILWQPNPNTRWDIFFPEPKLSSYMTTLGKNDWWWYIGGYYGGGSWTVERDDGTSDRIDINDLRVMVGFEWGKNELLRTGRRIGFIEGGYVFDRNITYVVDPTDTLDLENAWVLRAGLAY